MVRSVGAIALVLAVAGCAGSSSLRPYGLPSSTPPSRQTPTARPVHIPKGVPLIRPGRMDPQRVVMRVGERRGIRLSPADVPENGNWVPLRVTQNPSLLLVKQSGGYPGHSPVTALVTAQRVGTAKIWTGTDDRCFHYKDPCLPPQYYWNLTIKIVRVASS